MMQDIAHTRRLKDLYGGGRLSLDQLTRIRLENDRKTKAVRKGYGDRYRDKGPLLCSSQEERTSVRFKLHSNRTVHI
jgi:hypothetical protein